MNGIEEMAVRFTQAAAHLLWVGALVWLVVFLAGRVFVRAAAARHAVYLTGLLAMAAALPLCFLLPGSVTTLPAAAAAAGTPGQAIEMAPGGITGEVSPVVQPAAPLDPVGFKADEDTVIEVFEPLRVAPAEPADVWSRLSPWVSALYLGGLLAMSLRLIAGWAGSARLRNRAEPIASGPWREALDRMQRAVGATSEVALAWSREVAAPVVIGLVKPAVLLPMALASRLSPAQVEAVLAHELAHLCRGDHWAVVVQRIVETVLFFHPAVWWMSRRMESAREEACDDRVVAAGCDPADYAEALVICSECRLERAGVAARFAERLAAIGSEGAPLRHRVLRLLGQGDDGNVRLGHSGWVLALLVVGGVALAMGVGGGREDLADFDFRNPPGPYEKGIEVADRNQRFTVDGIPFQAGPLQWRKEGFLRLPEDLQGPGQELFLNLGTSGGYEIVEFRLFDHATRELIHDSHWQHPGDHQQDFFIERIGATNGVRLKETGGTLPERIDVWLRIATQDKGPVVVLDGREGASRSVAGSDLVITKLLAGSMNGKSAPSGEMEWDAATVHDQDRALTVNIENRGKPLEGRYHLVAVKKDGSRHPMDHTHFWDFRRMGSHGYFHMDVALADLDHFELIPFKDRHKFFFNGLVVPRAPVLDGVYRVRPEGSDAPGREVARSDAEGTFVLLDRLTGDFGTATVASTSNDNGQCRIDLQGAGPFPDGADIGPLALVVDGLAVGVWSHSDPDADRRMNLGASVKGRDAALRFAAGLGVEARLREHPGHRMKVSFTPAKPSIRPVEPVVLKLKIENAGDQPIRFMDGGRQRGARNNQFAFRAFRNAGRGPEVADTGDPIHFGGMAGYVTLETGEVFEKEVDVTKWFDLSQPDTYRIDGRFEMELFRDEAFRHPADWDEVAKATTMVVVSDQEEAGEETALGDEADGVSVKWESVEYQSGGDDHPHPVVVLGFAAYNRGPHRLHLPENGDYHQVEVDGRWYEWVAPPVLGNDEPTFSKGTRLLDFDPGDSHLKQSIRLAGNWRAIPEGKEREYAQRQLSGFAVLPGNHGEELVLKPGKHDVRIAVLCPPARAGLYRMIRGVSEPTVITIAAEMEGAARGQADDDLGAVFQAVERFARLPKPDQATQLAAFYKGLSPRTLNPAVEYILSSYPHDILQPNREGDPFDGNTSLWARQLEEAAKERSVEEVTEQLDRPVWIRVAARARALQVFERHPQATAELVGGDLESGEKDAIERASSVIVSLQLRGFSKRLLELWLADGVGAQAAWGALVFLRDPEIVGSLRERVKAEPAFIKRCSGLFQAPLAGEKADSLLLGLLDSPDAEIRYHAANALQECVDARLAGPAARLAGEKEARFRFLAAHLIGRLPEEAFGPVRESLLPLLADPDDEVRSYALLKFAGRKDLAAGPVILEALRGEAPNEQFKVWVMQAMAALSDKGWNYDMHRWGPDTPGNREAIARFEAWLKEQA